MQKQGLKCMIFYVELCAHFNRIGYKTFIRSCKLQNEMKEVEKFWKFYFHWLSSILNLQDAIKSWIIKNSGKLLNLVSLQTTPTSNKDLFFFQCVYLFVQIGIEKFQNSLFKFIWLHRVYISGNIDNQLVELKQIKRERRSTLIKTNRCIIEC